MLFYLVPTGAPPLPPTPQLRASKDLFAHVSIPGPSEAVEMTLEGQQKTQKL